MVIKAAQMGCPFLVSRSGLTQMIHREIAKQVGMTMIGRAVNKHFLLFNDPGRFVLMSLLGQMTMTSDDNDTINCRERGDSTRPRHSSFVIARARHRPRTRWWHGSPRAWFARQRAGAVSRRPMVAHVIDVWRRRSDRC